ncbi:hypothetical protein DH2020_033393 [Rehmannia glutinosa]|uniref:Uncharacterized protein n=1 Tax=Rehmannia glutinosa TaxID=99300 RepID=A0ABR0VDA3_REHGL
MLALIAQVNMAEVFGRDQIGDSVDMALETLPGDVLRFKVSYNMNKLNMSPTEPMKELQNAENVLKTKSGDAFVVTSFDHHLPSRKAMEGIRGKNENEEHREQELVGEQEPIPIIQEPPPG